MTNMRRQTSVSLTSFVCLALVVTSCFGCSCIPQSFDEMFCGTTYVVRVEVLDRETILFPDTTYQEFVELGNVGYGNKAIRHQMVDIKDFVKSPPGFKRNDVTPILQTSVESALCGVLLNKGTYLLGVNVVSNPAPLFQPRILSHNLCSFRVNLDANPEPTLPDCKKLVVSP